jgi:hypothetical protein
LGVIVLHAFKHIGDVLSTYGVECFFEVKGKGEMTRVIDNVNPYGVRDVSKGIFTKDCELVFKSWGNAGGDESVNDSAK